jgi:hypothetical protein
MTCASCGAPTRVGATFCGSCGVRLMAAAATAPPVVPVPDTASPPPPPSLTAPSAPPPPPPQVVAPAAPTPPPIFEVSPAAVSVPAPAGSAMIDVPTFGAPAAAPLAPLPPVAEASIDALDDRTRVAPPRRPRGSWRLVLPDGTSHPIAGTTVVGRQPEAAAYPGATAVLAIDDPDGLVSKSHAVLELDAGRLAVRDLHSTNGVVALTADGTEMVVSSDASTTLDDGFEIELGSFVIRIERV